MNYFICLLFSFYTDSCQEQFLKTVLFNRQKEMFLVINANNGLKKNEIVLSNIDLERSLKTKGITIDQQLINRIVSDHVILDLDDQTQYFGVVKKHRSTNRIRKKGKEFFINYYFDQFGNLRPERIKTFNTYLIKLLVNWNVLVFQSEGTIYIDRHNLCK